MSRKLSEPLCRHRAAVDGRIGPTATKETSHVQLVSHLVLELEPGLDRRWQQHRHRIGEHESDERASVPEADDVVDRVRFGEPDRVWLRWSDGSGGFRDDPVCVT